MSRSAHADDTPVQRPLAASVAPWLAGLGLATVVIGTFLPWLRSGQATRNSYQAGGAVQRLLAPDGVVHAVLLGWPFVSLACAAAIACYAVGMHRVGWLIGLIAAASAAAVAIAALSVAGTNLARPCVTGPVVTLIGSVLTLGAAILRFGTIIRESHDSRSQL